MVQKIGITERVLKVGKMSAKNDILTVQYKQRAHIGNKKKRSLEITTQEIELEAHRLKVDNINMKNKLNNKNNHYKI